MWSQLLLLLVSFPNATEGWILTDFGNIWNGVLSLPGYFIESSIEKLNNMTQFESPEDEKVKEEIFYTMFDFASRNGYPLETYYVTTEDGYILQIFRIPHGKNSKQGNGNVVFLQHGVFCSSEMWVCNGPNNSLGFYLADMQYDVWMGNFRGNLYARNHTNLNPDYSLKFWQFSCEQHGCYDLPAMIDFVLNVTKKPRLMYIGHSLGNEAALIMLTAIPEYNDKLNGIVALAASITPTTYGLPLEKILTFNLEIIRQIILLVTETGFTWEEGRRTKMATTIYLNLCRPDHPQLCKYIFDVVFGVVDDGLFDKNHVSILLNQIQSGGSIRQLLYQDQVSINRKYAKYSFGPVINELIYGDFEPPVYNVSSVTTPIIIFWADNDVFASPLNTAYLMVKLPSLVKTVEINHPLYNHLSYFISKQNHILLFPPISEAIDTLLSLAKPKNKINSQ